VRSPAAAGKAQGAGGEVVHLGVEVGELRFLPLNSGLVLPSIVIVPVCSPSLAVIVLLP